MTGSPQTTHPVTIRPASPDDAPEVAPLIDMAGGGVYRFLLDGLVPGMEPAEMLMPGLAGSSGSFSHRQIGVAEAGGRVVGVAHAYPVDWMRMEDHSGLPPDRMAHLEPFHGTQDWGSYFLSALAVEPDYRRRGIAGRLMQWVYGRARDGGYDRLTLHVWADNEAARSFYASEGFEETARAPIAWHERLPHLGGSILLSRSTRL
ncbi:GNAT family N-acetyltransferase [Azospirillum sp. SYSU D00513]|uniref:GNAT family N-acetyltransferase n=1 Tax=Azospirillum sp. SYSU D00513 TaxID=2812561 RepID=UPI001A972C8A|nr:GNAT family N-acetyltransferase [Azospirillum sp. SYSU D00513]